MPWDSPYSRCGSLRLECAPMFQHHHDRPWRRSFRWAYALAVGCASTVSAATDAVFSPVPERIAARDAWRIVETLTATQPDCEAMIGSGGSMLPLYPDHTVLIVRRLPMAEWRSGMTVVFIGDRGRPVAHALVEKTSRGWLAKGLANTEADRTLVRTRNYLGTVVRAFTPVIGLNHGAANLRERSSVHSLALAAAPRATADLAPAQ